MTTFHFFILALCFCAILFWKLAERDTRIETDFNILIYWIKRCEHEEALKHLIQDADALANKHPFYAKRIIEAYQEIGKKTLELSLKNKKHEQV